MQTNYLGHKQEVSETGEDSIFANPRANTRPCIHASTGVGSCRNGTDLVRTRTTGLEAVAARVSQGRLGCPSVRRSSWDKLTISAAAAGGATDIRSTNHWRVKGGQLVGVGHPLGWKDGINNDVVQGRRGREETAEWKGTELLTHRRSEQILNRHQFGTLSA